MRALLLIPLFSLACAPGLSRDEAFDLGCRTGDAIGIDNGELDANLCLDIAAPHLPRLPVAQDRHESAFLDGFEACYYDGYVDAYVTVIADVNCEE